MTYKLALLLVVCIKMSFSATAQKQEIIDYMDSCYNSTYDYDKETEDGWHINKYEELREDSIYIIDTSLNVVLETQIRTKQEMIDVMSSLADTLLFDTLMLTYYDMINDEFKSSKYVQENNFLPIDSFAMIPTKMDTQGTLFFDSRYGEQYFDSLFKKSIFFKHDLFEVEIEEGYTCDNLFYRHGDCYSAGVNLKITNTLNDSLSLFIGPLDMFDLEQSTVIKFSNYLVVSFWSGLFSQRDNINYDRLVDFTIIDLENFSYWRPEQQILWEETEYHVNNKRIQIQVPFTRRISHCGLAYNYEIEKMFRFLGYDVSLPNYSKGDIYSDELNNNSTVLSKNYDLTSKVSFNHKGIITYSIKTLKYTKTESFFLYNGYGFLEFEDVFNDVDFVDNYIKQQLICIDSNQTYFIGDHFIDNTIKPDNFDDIKKQTYYTYHLLRYELLYIDKQGVNIRLRFKQMNNPNYLYFDIELSYKECRGQLTPLILEALRPKFNE